MIAKARDILRLIDGFAPWERAEEWDNPGLLAGRADQEIRCVLCALDPTGDVILEAAEAGAQMILTHHPILFRGRKNLTEDDPEGRILCALVRSRLCLVAAHTNYDFAAGGVNDVLAGLLELQGIRALPSGMRVGEIGPTRLQDFSVFVRDRLGDAVRLYGAPDKSIRRVAVMGGAGGEYALEAAEAGADAFVTGEIHHHQGLTLAEMGLCALEAGHGATEWPAVPVLADRLRDAARDAEYGLQVITSASAPIR